MEKEESNTSMEAHSTKLSEEVRSYLDQHKIEPILTKAFNEVMNKLPIDPFSEICSILKTESKDIFTINSITLKEIIVEDFKSIPAFEISITYKGATRTVLKYPVPFNTAAYEKFINANEELSTTFNEIFNTEIKSLNYETPNQFDENLMNIIKKKEKETDPMTLSLSNTISLMTLLSTAMMKNITLSEYLKEYNTNFIFNNPKKVNNFPNLGFCIFKTGKNMNSKIKYERFLLMVNCKNENNEFDPKILIDLYPKMFDVIKKTLTAGKAGENGMKTNNEGSFTPPSDKYEDVLKLMETFVKDINTLMDNKNIVSLGIDCNADNFYNNKDNTYDAEGAKKALDNVSLVDTYLKFITDHPSLSYLEEPMAYEDEEGWGMLIEKLKDNNNISLVKKVDLYRKEPEPKVVTSDNNANVTTENKPVENQTEEKPKSNTKKSTKKGKKKVDVKTEEQQIKTEENVKKEPPKIDLLSYRLADANVMSDLLNHIVKMKEKNKEVGGVIYENDIESDQTGIINLGLAINCDFIILNGLNMSDQKITKIKEYIEEIENMKKANGSQVEVPKENNTIIEEKKNEGEVENKVEEKKEEEKKEEEKKEEEKKVE